MLQPELDFNHLQVNPLLLIKQGYWWNLQSSISEYTLVHFSIFLDNKTFHYYLLYILYVFVYYLECGVS